MVISLKDYLEQASLRDAERSRKQQLKESEQEVDIQVGKITQSTIGGCNTLLENI